MPQYPGGKNGAGTYQKIINRIPPHRVYIEAFFGSGAIMRAKRPADLNIGIELNPYVLAESAEQIGPGCIIINGGAIPASDILSSPLAMAAAITPSGDMAGDPLYRFFNLDCARFLAAYPFKGDEFVYLDPPYVRGSRRSPDKLYSFEYDDDDHIALIAILKTLNCSIAISGYASELYSDLLTDWRSYSFEAVTRAGMATEYLWMNYPPTLKLHDYQYLGENFRKREKIKLKKNRLVNKLARMNPLERAAMLWAIQESGIENAPAGNTDNGDGFRRPSPQTVISPAPSPQLALWSAEDITAK